MGLTRHHIVARSLGGTDHIDNISMLEQKVHQRLHTFFWNALPHEQLWIITDIASTALVPSFRKSLLEVLGDYNGGYYKRHTLKNWIYQ